MRLYLSAESKNHIGYTPDTLIVEHKGRTFIYDIQGNVDYDKDGLNCRVKGILALRDDNLDDYVELNDQGYKDLAKMLSDPTTKVIVAIYPDSEFEHLTEQLNTDEVNGFGEFCYDNESYAFEFNTEFYGI